MQLFKIGIRTLWKSPTFFFFSPRYFLLPEQCPLAGLPDNNITYYYRKEKLNRNRLVGEVEPTFQSAFYDGI